MKSGKNGLSVNVHRLTDIAVSGMMSYFQDGGHDVFSRRKVLPSGEYTVHTTVWQSPMQKHLPFLDL